MIKQPEGFECNSPYYFSYINRVETNDLVEFCKDQKEKFLKFIHSIPPDKEEYRYAEGKWTLKEVIGHCIDTERIMSYRAFSIARGEQQKLPGFDQDLYVKLADFEKRTLADLAKEFGFLRDNNIFMMGTFTEDMLVRIGSANGQSVSSRALLYVLSGHLEHHLEVINEKYLVK